MDTIRFGVHFLTSLPARGLVKVLPRQIARVLLPQVTWPRGAISPLLVRALQRACRLVSPATCQCWVGGACNCLWAQVPLPSGTSRCAELPTQLCGALWLPCCQSARSSALCWISWSPTPPQPCVFLPPSLPWLWGLLQKSQALTLPQPPGSCLWAAEQSWSSPLSLSHGPFLLLGTPSLPSHGSRSRCVTHPSTALPAPTFLGHFGGGGRPLLALGPSLLLLCHV